jgi:outer membrane lipoprotein-sorting protein
MGKAIIGFLITALSFTAGRPYSQNCAADAPCCPLKEEAANAVESVLERLQKTAADLRSYRCKLDYVFEQPLLESQTRQKGMLYYAVFDERSYLRIDFRTFQQDEEAEQAYRQEFIFDGVWLWRIDYQTESGERRQMSEPNQPLDAFALASRQMPVLGLSKRADLEKQFEIELILQERTERSPWHHLHLTVKPDSVYRDDYVTIDFWTDKKLGLPAKVAAVTTEQEISEIKLLEPEVNKGIDKSVFDPNIPVGFSMETIVLEDRGRPK